jgi:hypothetical protein
MTNLKRVCRVGLTFILLTLVKNSFSQTISPGVFGQNAWMPDTIGNVNNCTDPPCIFNGKLYQQWGNIKRSGATMIRYGGTAVDKNIPTNYQYVRMIDSIRANGMEPIIQVPFYNHRYTAQQAAAIVQYINITKGKNIKYWVIGNEPNLGYSYTTRSLQNDAFGYSQDNHNLYHHYQQLNRLYYFSHHNCYGESLAGCRIRPRLFTLHGR